MSVENFESGVEPVKELPDGDEIDLSAIEGWEKLAENQRLWIVNFFDNFPKKTKTTLESGVNREKVSAWREEDQQFNEFVDIVSNLHSESLASVQYQEAYENSKIRAKTLKAINAPGWEKKDSTTNNKLVINTGKDMRGALKELQGE